MNKVKVIDSVTMDPAGEYILVKIDKEDDYASRGGVIIPTGALQNKKTQTGVISAVGRGRRDPRDFSCRIPIDCEVGERILFACYIGYPVMIMDEEYVFIKHTDIMSRVTEKFHYVDEEDAPLSKLYV